MNPDHLHSALLASNSGDITPYGGLKPPLYCRLSTIWLPVEDCQYETSTSNAASERHVRLDPTPREAATRLTALIRFGVDAHMQHAGPHHDRSAAGFSSG
ncbi:hypothetical protein [Streptomyces sp. NBC_00076]|uniref:hypothetical protein n=1 Tax=Streptomyces sp. NBC_00076 TaxID=2975642 RepID=UPI003253822E